jgi:transposase InsO family protein
VTLHAFHKWAIDFVGPINPQAKITGERYIITTMKYLTRWAEATPVKDCSAETVAHFLLEQVITSFGCPRVLMSDQGTHFINSTIRAMLKEFEFHHQKSTSSHPQENGTVESFNKVLENALTKICNVNRDKWDLKILAVLWAYRTTCKKLKGHTPLKLDYGQEVVVPLEFLISSLRVATITQMTECGMIQERLHQLLEMEEDRILAGFHQQVQKARDKAWHDRHIKKKTFTEADLVLLYDIKSFRHPGKLRMHWLGPYEVKYVTNGGVVQLRDIAGVYL